MKNRSHKMYKKNQLVVFEIIPLCTCSKHFFDLVEPYCSCLFLVSLKRMTWREMAEKLRTWDEDEERQIKNRLSNIQNRPFNLKEILEYWLIFSCFSWWPSFLTGVVLFVRLILTRFWVVKVACIYSLWTIGKHAILLSYAILHELLSLQFFYARFMEYISI